MAFLPCAIYDRFTKVRAGDHAKATPEKEKHAMRPSILSMRSESWADECLVIVDVREQSALARCLSGRMDEPFNGTEK